MPTFPTTSTPSRLRAAFEPFFTFRAADGTAGGSANEADASPLTLIVPLDNSAFGRAVAPQIYKLFPAPRYRLELLHVARPPVEVDPAVSTPAFFGADAAFYHVGLGAAEPRLHPVEDDERLHDFRAQLRDELQTEVDDFAARGYDVSATVLFGEPATEIVRQAEELGADAIAMATHARSGLQRFLLGSVGKDVLENTQIPVLLFPTELPGEAGERDEASDADSEDDDAGAAGA